MKRVKGCLNNDCSEYTKKRLYKESDNFCVKCGSKLNFVCKDCFKQLPDDGKEKYCLLHLAEREGKEVTPKKIVAGVVGAVGAVGVAVAPVAKFIKNIKK